MKTDLRLLWIDDNEQFVDSLRPPLLDWTDLHGFALDVLWHESEEGVFEDLAREDIELIVLDYNLPMIKGNELVLKIRAGLQYQDIIFYSQSGPPMDAFETPPDGVFFVARTDVKERIKDILSLRVRRASELSTLRGWFVADAIELEMMLDGLIALCFGRNEVLFTKRFLGEENKFDFYTKCSLLNGLLKDFLVDLKAKDGESALVRELVLVKETLKKFADEIIHIRNGLAHQTSEFGADGHNVIKIKHLKPPEITLSPEKCAELRNGIRKHFDNLQKLKELLPQITGRLIQEET